MTVVETTAIDAASQATSIVMDSAASAVSSFIIPLILGITIGWLVFKKHENHDSPAFQAPDGTVRAILVLSAVGAYIHIVTTTRWSPEGLTQLVSIMIGYYFGASKQNASVPPSQSVSVQTPAATTTFSTPSAAAAPVVVPTDASVAETPEDKDKDKDIEEGKRP